MSNRRANLRLRKSVLALTGAAALTALLTACNGTVNGTISDNSPKPVASNTATTGGTTGTTGTTGATKGGSSTGGSGQSTAKDSDATGKGTEDGVGSGYDTGNGRVPVGQSCGANDITWSTRSRPRPADTSWSSRRPSQGLPAPCPPPFRRSPSDPTAPRRVPPSSPSASRSPSAATRPPTPE